MIGKARQRIGSIMPELASLRGPIVACRGLLSGLARGSRGRTEKKGRVNSEIAAMSKLTHRRASLKQLHPSEGPLFGSAPRRRGSLVEEDSTQRVVD